MTLDEPVVYVKLSGKSANPQPKKSFPRWALVLIVIVLLVLVILPVLFLTGVFSSDSEENFSDDYWPPARNAMPLNLSNSLNGFSMDLYKEIVAKSPGENVFFSPMSVMTAMSMTLLGCRANTHVQLSKVLNIEHNNDQVKDAFAKLIVKYPKSSPDYELRTANMMYVSDELALREEYSSYLQTAFHASSKTVNFGTEADKVKIEINEAVEKETNNKIKDLIPDGVLNHLTRLVLVNAAYFKGLWTHQFEKEETSDSDFYTSETETVKVPMMKIKEKFQYSESAELNASMLAMDYKNSNLSMVIVLPKQKTGINDVEEKLHTMDIGNFLKKTSKSEVRVGLPKFKLEYDSELSEILSKMGAGDLFTAGVSDLSGIGSTPGDLYVSNVIHKAFVEVNEEGTEAAAATGVVMMTRMMPMRPRVFVVDRPFSFFIYDKDLDMTLFAGRVMLPAVSQTKVEL